jgi:nitrogen regulatory protein PII
MQMIEAVIKPNRLAQVKEALASYGILGVTAVECKGIGRELPRMQRYRGNGAVTGVMPRILLKVCVKDYEAPPAVHAIRSAARSGAVGDGKVFVFPVAHAIRIRTGEVNDAAI